MNVEISDLSLETVPRNLLELQRLSSEERELIYRLLDREVETRTSFESFTKMLADEQAIVLAQLLMDYDHEEAKRVPEPPEFSVIALELPLRTEVKKYNRDAWREFGAEIEGALNRLEDAGLELETAMKFEGHGIIIVGRKAKQGGSELTIGMPIPIASILPKGIQEALAARSAPNPRAPNPHRDTMSAIATAASRVITNTSDADDIRAAVSSVVRTVADLPGFKEYVQQEYDSHERACTTPGCPVHLMLQVTLEEIEARHNSMC